MKSNEYSDHLRQDSLYNVDDLVEMQDGRRVVPEAVSITWRWLAETANHAAEVRKFLKDTLPIFEDSHPFSYMTIDLDDKEGLVHLTFDEYEMCFEDILAVDQWTNDFPSNHVEQLVGATSMLMIRMNKPIESTYH